MYTQLKRPLYGALTVLCLLGLTISAPVMADTVSNNSRLIKHDNSSGGKSRDTIVLTAPKVATGQCVAFADARIDYKKRRFGKASILAKPAKGCNPAEQRCVITVLSQYSPVGFLHFRVKAEWEVSSSGC